MDMRTQKGRDVQFEMLKWFVYPGHPAVVAYNIMLVFDKLSDAMANTEHNFPEALGNSSVEGAGGEVYVGLRFLKEAAKNKDWEALYREHSEHWAHYRAGGIEKNVTPGQEKADELKPLLLKTMAEWDFS